MPTSHAPRMPVACVYVMAADNGEVKVGFSGTPYARLSKVKREYGARRGFTGIRLVGTVWTHAALEVEAEVIRLLVGCGWAVGGEWFRCDPEQTLQAVIREAEAWQAHPSVAIYDTPEPPTPSG